MLSQDMLLLSYLASKFYQMLFLEYNFRIDKVNAFHRLKS